MTYAEKQELLDNSLKQLTTHPAFIEFVDAIKQMKESAIVAAVSEKTFKTPYRTVGALGEVRAYVDILNLVEDYRQRGESATGAG
jgi:hypothetical protein